MARNPGDGLVRAGKLLNRAPREPDLRDAPEHQQWVSTLGNAHLPSRILDDFANVEKGLKKSALEYTVKELSPISPLAPVPQKQDVVLYTLKGKVVGYSVGVTPLNNTR